MKYFFSFLTSIISLFIICFKSNEKKKNLIFYFPVKIYQKNLIEISDKLSKKFNVFLIYNYQSSEEISKRKNSYLLDFNLLKYIPFNNFFLKDINFFFSSYISYVYPPNSKNIYISHDIYDAPMINTKLEKELFLRISKIDYIFVSSNISKKYFLKKFNFYNLLTTSKIINTGYLKLDHLLKIIKKKRYKFGRKSVVLLAPGYFYAFQKFNMYSKIETIILKILKNNNLILIFRPHPLDLTRKGDKHFVDNMLIKFSKFKNFKFDGNVSYIESFKKSDLMITDLSSTAYTYSFSTNNPVIFFSKNEKKLKKEKFSEAFYFHDRNQIGFICKDENKLNSIINYSTKSKKKFLRNIKNLKKKRIEYLFSAKTKTLKEIKKIID